MTAHVPNGEMELVALETARPRAAQRYLFGARARRLQCHAYSSQRTLRRAYSDAFAFELCSQFTREFNCARCIAMDANRFAAHIDIAAFDRAHFAYA